MKKITRVLMSITCLVLLTVFTIGCEDKVDKKAIKQDEDRIVEYIKEKVELENKEEIRKIKFVEYEKNTSTGAWHYDVVINDKINLMFTVWRENKKVVLSFTKKGDINLIEYKKNKYESNIEVIYEK
ncbi:hypothetical protein [Gemella sanguinis]|uniref:hypothetical protein n=1 Tax=Gemella sanguinis TaxID=84135 RepID=UPI0004E0CEF6|nr:hypothetical protein [Gemella sanguinis]NKZ26066.1 hypothetical protein [Gemella sanguinis]